MLSIDARLLCSGDYRSNESFSESAFRALNISTTTRTVIAIVMGSLSENASQFFVHFEDVTKSFQLFLGPSCRTTKKLSTGLRISHYLSNCRFMQQQDPWSILDMVNSILRKTGATNLDRELSVIVKTTLQKRHCLGCSHSMK